MRPPPSVSKVSASGTLWTEKIIQCFEEFSAKGIDASLFKLDDEPTTIDFLNTLDGHMMKYQKRQTHNNSGKNVCESNLCRKKMKGSSIFIQIDTFLDAKPIHWTKNNPQTTKRGPRVFMQSVYASNSSSLSEHF